MELESVRHFEIRFREPGHQDLWMIGPVFLEQERVGQYGLYIFITRK
jgi:hypothetical protein